MDWEIKSDEPTLTVGRLWNVHCQIIRGAEAEMNECPYEIFGDISLERDGANRRVRETACPVESFRDSNTWCAWSLSPSIP